MGTTNVAPGELNYDRYGGLEYDDEIVRVIPGHEELHHAVGEAIKNRWQHDEPITVLDLGAGTGLTSQVVRSVLPNARLTLVDFSEQMLASAKERFGTQAEYVLGDYAEVEFPEASFDLVVSVIGFHHQTDIGKRSVIRKVYDALRPGGMFILADLVTFRDLHKSALAKAHHFHHLVEHASSEEKLTEWARHHEYLNELAALEDIQVWLGQTGFVVTTPFVKYQTALLIGRKA